MGTQIFWCAHPSSHSYATNQSGPGSLSHMAGVHEDVEYEKHAVLRTPRKEVRKGTGFQAELPQLIPVNREGGLDIEPDSLRWLGECVWPLGEGELVASERLVSRTRAAFCSCAVRNAMECVRLHIEEEREALKNELGSAFYAWGLDEMGEIVTEHWTCEEELAFQQLVRKNPLSQKKDFWCELLLAFPSRCTRELVSYYFNVFVLRRRAIQNRVAPWSIDSDDDEMAFNSEDDDSASLFESDEEVDESHVDEVARDYDDDVDGSLSHTADDSGDEENFKRSYLSGEHSYVVVKEDHAPAKASPRACHMQDSRMVELDMAQSLHHILECSHDVINQAERYQAMDQPNHCHSNQDEGKPKLPCITYSTLDTQQSGDCSAYKESLLVKSHQCVLDQWETKVWDAPSPNSSQKDFDKLISTKGMMEEFFGAESC